MSKPVCMQVCRLVQGGHKLVHGKLACVQYKQACILDK